MATTCTISIASDIAPGFGGINESMTLTQAGTITDIDSTTGFQRRKLSATGAVDLVTMASELIEPKDSVAAKIFIRNGWKVLITGRRGNRLEDLTKELGENCLPLCFDITDRVAVKKEIENIASSK